VQKGEAAPPLPRAEYGGGQAQMLDVTALLSPPWAMIVRGGEGGKGQDGRYGLSS
jgi:hypothetical protein